VEKDNETQMVFELGRKSGKLIRFETLIKMAKPLSLSTNTKSNPKPQPSNFPKIKAPLKP